MKMVKKEVFFLFFFVILTCPSFLVVVQSFCLAIPTSTTATIVLKKKTKNGLQQQQQQYGHNKQLCDVIPRRTSSASLSSSSSLFSSSNNNNNIENNEEWQGEVVSNTVDGRIRGCTLQPVDNNKNDTPTSTTTIPTTTTEWIVTIDGEQADLGQFSQAIYKKLMMDAKTQQFQGFRPGTIPPQLQITYKAYCMDECARETVLEAMEQNNIQPFDETTRSNMILTQFQIPPIVPTTTTTNKNKSKKKKSNDHGSGGGGNRKKSKKLKGRRSSSSSTEAVSAAAPVVPATQAVGVENQQQEQQPDKDETKQELNTTTEPLLQWRSFDTMKDAIQAGWKPGQSFSFVATNVRGQRVQATTPNQEPESATINSLLRRRE